MDFETFKRLHRDTLPKDTFGGVARYRAECAYSTYRARQDATEWHNAQLRAAAQTLHEEIFGELVALDALEASRVAIPDDLFG